MFVVAFFLQLAAAVKYRDCGTSGITINSVLVTPCPKEPCELVHGQTYKIEVDFDESVNNIYFWVVSKKNLGIQCSCFVS